MREEYYTVEEVAGRIEVTPRTIRNYLKQGKLKGKKVGGKWRFSSEDVERLLSDPFHSLQSIDDPIQTFTTDRTLIEGEARAMLVLDFNSTQSNIESLKESVINEYNNVYQGAGRELFYHRLSLHSASFVLIGNPLYVTRFASWISDRISKLR